ncbi:Translation initiation factor [Trichinella pseudospiralis]
MKIFVEYDSKIVQLNVPTHMTVSELVKLSKEEFGITGPNYTLFFNRTDKVGDLGASLSSAGIIENMRLLLDKSAEVEKCSLTGGESEQLKNAVNSLLQGNCNSFEFLIEVTNAIFLQKHFKVPSDGPVLAPDWKEKANADGIVRMNYVHPENSGKFEVVAIWFGRQSNHQFVEFVASNAFNNDCTPIRFTVKNLPDITSDNIAYLRVKPLIDHLLTELVEKIKDNHDNARGLSSSFPFFGTGGPDDLNPLGGGIPRMPNIFPDYNEPPSFMGPLAPHGNRPRGPRYDPPFPYDTQGQIRLPRPGRGGPPSGYGNYFI